MAQDRFRNILPPNESIHHILIAGVAALDNNVVDNCSESRIPNQRQSKGALLVVVMAFAKRHKIR